MQVLPKVEPLVRLQLRDTTSLEGVDKVCHALPQVRHLLESAENGHAWRIIERTFESNRPRMPPWYRLHS
jgi:hypothetical protein